MCRCPCFTTHITYNTQHQGNEAGIRQSYVWPWDWYQPNKGCQQLTKDCKAPSCCCCCWCYCSSRACFITFCSVVSVWVCVHVQIWQDGFPVARKQSEGLLCTWDVLLNVPEQLWGAEGVDVLLHWALAAGFLLQCEMEMWDKTKMGESCRISNRTNLRSATRTDPTVSDFWLLTCLLLSIWSLSLNDSGYISKGAQFPRK